jgi:hypothetical protein
MDMMVRATIASIKPKPRRPASVLGSLDALAKTCSLSPPTRKGNVYLSISDVSQCLVWCKNHANSQSTELPNELNDKQEKAFFLGAIL